MSPKRSTHSGETLDDSQKRLIIQEVHCYPSLYNIRHDDYKKPKRKAEQISAIAARLNLSSELVQSTWNSIHAKYRTELRKVKETEVSGAGANEIYEPSWEFWKDLQFVRDKTIICKTSGNLDSLLGEKKSLPVAASSTMASSNSSSLSLSLLGAMEWYQNNRKHLLVVMVIRSELDRRHLLLNPRTILTSNRCAYIPSMSMGKGSWPCITK
ncbi:hypothetical protein TKK_0014350 [Trichogramma kaykai]|uniref:MADF domain-containing protein n=1 Tax=Trichogramma kaykai TaxID=54128 RepID=A0ABD2WEJ5_9HYME